MMTAADMGKNKSQTRKSTNDIFAARLRERGHETATSR